jgi:hypothetical protein
MRSLAVAGLTLLLLTSTPAHAAKRRVVIIEEEDDTEPRNVTLTLSPVHLIGPFGEITGEVRATDTIGVALIGGVGRMPIGGAGAGARFWDLGAQFRYYLSGTFSDGGLLVGAEVLYLRAPKDADATTIGANLTASALVGWKLATRVGFTIDSQFGVSTLIVKQRSDGEGRTLQLLGNLGVGWTF